MIKPSQFKDWQEYYWTYQNILAKKYLIPMLKAEGISIDGKKIFEIGCGSGGVIEAFAERSARAVGLDITPFEFTRLGTNRVEYVTADIFDLRERPRYADRYDLIVFRDVIEHIAAKDNMFSACDELLAPDGHILMTFPPFYSAYGAHQQVFSKRFLTRLPYVQFLPKHLYLRFVKAVENGNEPAYRVAAEIQESKTTIRSLKRHIRRSVFEIQKEHDYFIRPSFEIRYGIKPRKAQWLGRIPWLREISIMGVYLILKRRGTP
jgi:SAM-dependent methyltransferase